MKPAAYTLLAFALIISFASALRAEDSLIDDVEQTEQVETSQVEQTGTEQADDTITAPILAEGLKDLMEAWPRPPVAPTPPAARPTPSTPLIFDTADVALRLYRIEARLAKVEKEKLDEPAVRRVAEDVFRKLAVTIRTPSGQQRSEVIQAGTTVNGFHLNPGEVLVGYTDIYSGQYVSMSQQQQPNGRIDYQAGPNFQMQQMGTEARVRWVEQPQPMPQPMQMAPMPMPMPTQCQMINGRKVCN